MSMSRRKFFGAATAASATLALTSAWSEEVAAPYRIKVTGRSRNGEVAGRAGDPAAIPVIVPATMAMGSGAPLGGIGTGSVELRPDGCFHDWDIVNRGPWSASGRQTPPGPNAPVPPNLRFFLWTNQRGRRSPQLRRFYLRSDENDLYSLGYAQDVEAIDYEAWFPMITLRYHDRTLPVRAGATAFSPFMPGKARESATPGFHVVFILENTSDETAQASVLSILDNPIVSTLADRRLKNTVRHEDGAARLIFETDAQPGDQSDLGSLCWSVTGGKPSWISGTFQPFALPGLCRWESRRVHAMLLDVLQDFFKAGRLPDTEAERDPAHDFKLDDDEINALSRAQLQSWIGRLSGDALFRRVIAEARTANPRDADSDEQMRMLLKEIARNLSGNLAGRDREHSTWGTGALASTVTLAPGQRLEIRFTLGWFFPHHHNARGEEIGHRYANWFNHAAEVVQFLSRHYAGHREGTERFARTLADTSLGGPLAFAWSSHLGTLVKNTWWSKDGHYAIWEGLGCCGLSTTDVDYDGSSSIVALFPELKLGQMKDILQFQNAQGQVPHNYSDSFDRVDRGGYGRVDMNPQFVMMVCRDYLWTGDQEYLAAIWPGVAKAMEYTALLDTDGDGLPDKDCGLQTYDQWSMRGAPSYFASLWIGALRAVVRLARDLGKTDDARRWQELLDKASASFDRVLFNGQYYSLWVDGAVRDEICMSDQVSGEWFSHLMGLPTTTSTANLATATDSIWKNNFSPETGLRNATAPRGGPDGLVMDNLQAGGVWSGIEYAFASFLMDHGRFADGARLVEAVHRRYLRAGMPWNHVECGSHYTRAMSSWTTLLAATGFKPDRPAQSLAVLPGVPGDFHAPWVTADGFGRLSRKAGSLIFDCHSGALTFKRLWVSLPNTQPSVRLAGRAVEAAVSREGAVSRLEFSVPLSIRAGQTCSIG
ncbi:MAG: hypothetical protein KGJ60_02230 [Verrucomicrobiota bacterium]|nr:hypothetical protein [Verrucomicrobiota bacterium]